MSKEAINAAIEALKASKHGNCDHAWADEAIAELEALAEQQAPVQQEPVAWIEHHKGGDNLEWDYPCANSSPLYTTPPQRTWVGLSLTEQADCYANAEDGNDFYKAIEAKLKEKND